MKHARLPFAGVDLIATLEGALFWPQASALIVADLHLEKATAFAGRGRVLPPLDSRATLDRLSGLVDTFNPMRVLCLGDSFHDAGGPARLGAADRATLARLAFGREWIWLVGNHDPAPTALCGGEAASCVALGPLILRHEAAPGAPPGEVSGHYHPKASVVVAGKRLSARCFVTDGRRLILPAFGAYTGGMDIRDPVFLSILEDAFTAFLIGRNRVHAIPGRRLSGPRLVSSTAAGEAERKPREGDTGAA